MIRDFSIYAEDTILGYVDFKETEGNGMYSVTFSEAELAEYEKYRDDIQYHMNNIELHHQYLIQMDGYTRETIEQIFADVRQFDQDYAKVIYDDKCTTYNPYKTTMKSLLDSIKVSHVGQGVSDVDGSIFCDTATFSTQITNAGGGLLEEVYRQLQDDDAFIELMKRDINEVKPWELVALSMRFDDCIYVDSNGKYQVDNDMLSQLIDMCYERTEFREYVSQPDVTIDGYATYEMYPIMSLLAEYKNNYTDYNVSIYTDRDDKREKKIDKIIAQCYVTDVIYAVSTYYSSIKLDTVYDKDYTKLHIGIDNSSQEKMVIYVDNMYEEKRNDITIYGFSEDLSANGDKAKKEADASEVVDSAEEVLVRFTSEFFSKSTGKYVGILAEQTPVIGDIYKVYNYIKSAKSVINAYTDAEENNAEVKTIVKNDELLMAAKALNCYGSVIQYEKMVTVSHLSGNETSNIIDLALYNEYSEEPEITQEQLDSEFVALMSGECTYSECVSIDAIQTFNRASGHGGEEHPLYIYDDYIDCYLKEEYMYEHKYQATDLQLQEAAQYAAERWHEDENEIYENRK